MAHATTVQFCFFRCNNVEFSVQMENGSVCWDVERISFVFFDVTNGSVCWDVERISFVFFDVTTSSSLFRWETVQSVGMWNG